jgi:hypothetical protein
MWTNKGTNNAYYKYEPHQFYRTHWLYYYKSITGDQTVHNYRQDLVMIDKNILETYLVT